MVKQAGGDQNHRVSGPDESHPSGGATDATIIRELFFDAAGKPLTSVLGATTIEVEVRYSDGRTERTYLTRQNPRFPKGRT